jgi:hypothetical protein
LRIGALRAVTYDLFFKFLPIVCWRMPGAPEKVSVRSADIDPWFDIV